MTSFLNLLIQISKKRRLYIGNAGIKSLHHVRTGYEMCLEHNGIVDDGEFKKFELFAFKSLGEPFGALSIWSVIANRTKSDDEAFDLLFTLLNEYCAKNSISIS